MNNLPSHADEVDIGPCLTAARVLFAELLPDITERAEAYRVSAVAMDTEMYRLLLDEVATTVTCLATECAQHDEVSIRKRGHSLEGMGGTVGLPEISVVGWALSHAAREHAWERCASLTGLLRRWSVQLSTTVPPHGGSARQLML